MADKIITIVLQGFVDSVPVLFTKGDETTGHSVSRDSLIQYVASLAEKEQVKDIKISSSKVYGEPIAADIAEYASLQYSNNDLRIEVIPQ